MGGVMSKEQIKIQGMSCQHCVASVKKALETVAGLSEVRVDLEKGEASFSRADSTPMDAAKKAVEEAGYTVASR